MKTLEESVLTTLDVEDKELFPYLPYILQDIWELGTLPEVIIRLLEGHPRLQNGFSVVDLGCGKGAVSVQVAARFGCRCHGIDAIPEFIAEARQKAVEYRADHLCTFETGDIRLRIRNLPPADVIILGALGPVFGDYTATLASLQGCLTESGIILIDDGYIDDHSDFSHPGILKRSDMLGQITSSGFRILEEEIILDKDLKTMNAGIFSKLEKRCLELAGRYPGRETLFTDYIRKQAEENEVFGSRIICSTMKLGKIGS
jgi:SAM-dependent methyltransferase